MPSVTGGAEHAAAVVAPPVMPAVRGGEQVLAAAAETLAGDLYLEERADVDRYTLAFDRLLAAALHPDDSLRLVQQAADAMT